MTSRKKSREFFPRFWLLENFELRTRVLEEFKSRKFTHRGVKISKFPNEDFLPLYQYPRGNNLEDKNEEIISRNKSSRNQNLEDDRTIKVEEALSARSSGNGNRGVGRSSLDHFFRIPDTKFQSSRTNFGQNFWSWVIRWSATGQNDHFVIFSYKPQISSDLHEFFFPGQKKSQQLYSSWILMKKSFGVHVIFYLLSVPFILTKVWKLN